jgi:hypothetical protein
MTVTDNAIYVYGVARALPRDAVAGIRGMSGTPVELIEHAGLTAVVSPVSLDDFGEDALRENLEHLDWLESTARTHHAVVDGASDSAPVVPLGLATVYRTEDRVRETLDARHEEFDRALARITGRTEWGVKAYADLNLPASGARAEAASSARPGTSYLQRRRTEQQSAEESRHEVLAVAQRVDDELRDIAAAGRLHRPQDPQLSGERGWMILNAAYLVDDDRAEDFRAAVRRLAGLRPELRLQLTGPWAPYSFATEEEEEEEEWTGL